MATPLGAPLVTLGVRPVARGAAAGAAASAFGSAAPAPLGATLAAPVAQSPRYAMGFPGPCTHPLAEVRWAGRAPAGSSGRRRSPGPGPSRPRRPATEGSGRGPGLASAGRGVKIGRGSGGAPKGGLIRGFAGGLSRTPGRGVVPTSARTSALKAKISTIICCLLAEISALKASEPTGCGRDLGARADLGGSRAQARSHRYKPPYVISHPTSGDPDSGHAGGRSNVRPLEPPLATYRLPRPANRTCCDSASRTFLWKRRRCVPLGAPQHACVRAPLPPHRLARLRLASQRARPNSEWVRPALGRCRLDGSGQASTMGWARPMLGWRRAIMVWC